jgi:hypothetical protein
MEESILVGRSVGDLHAMGRTLLCLAEVKIDAGRPDEAIAPLQEALEIAWTRRNLIDVAMCFGTFARALGAIGDTLRAAQFWGAAERLDDELGQTQYRQEKQSAGYQPPPAVLGEAEGIAAGKALTTAEAARSALLVDSPSPTGGSRP